MSPVVKDPSESLSCGDPIYDLLRDDFLRRSYNKIINSCRDYHHWDAKSWFLQKLIDEKIIPSYFRINTTSVDSDAAAALSIDAMKRALEINKTQALVHGDTMHSHFTQLAALIPAELQGDLLTKIKNKGLGFQKKFKYTGEGPQ